MNDLMSGQMALGAAQQKSDMLGKLFGTGQATQPAAQQQVAPMQSKSASLIPNQQQIDMTKRISSPSSINDINNILYSPTMGNVDPGAQKKLMNDLFSLFFK